MQPALFLDRDGVINEDLAYVHRIEDFHFVRGIFTLVKHFRAKGFLVVVITNQAGIGRGKFCEEQFHKLNDWMLEQFEKNAAPIDLVKWCPHHPTAGIGKYLRDCPNRKPRPGMILEAVSELDIDLKSSLLLGDKDSDIRAGIAAGLATNVLLKSRYWKEEIPASHTVENLENFVRLPFLDSFLKNV